MEFYSEIYRRYFEEYESFKIALGDPWTVGLLPESYILAWMDQPENIRKSLEKRGKA